MHLRSLPILLALACLAAAGCAPEPEAPTGPVCDLEAIAEVLEMGAAHGEAGSRIKGAVEVELFEHHVTGQATKR